MPLTDCVWYVYTVPNRGTPTRREAPMFTTTAATATTACPACSGEGWAWMQAPQGIAHSHVCFACEGSGQAAPATTPAMQDALRGARPDVWDARNGGLVVLRRTGPAPAAQSADVDTLSALVAAGLAAPVWAEAGEWCDDVLLPESVLDAVTLTDAGKALRASLLLN